MIMGSIINIIDYITILIGVTLLVLIGKFFKDATNMFKEIIICCYMLMLTFTLGFVASTFSFVFFGDMIILLSLIFLVMVSKIFYSYSKIYGFKNMPFVNAIIAKSVYEKFLSRNDLTDMKKLTGKELIRAGVIKNGKVALSIKNLEKRGYVKGFSKILKEELIEKF